MVTTSFLHLVQYKMEFDRDDRRSEVHFKAAVSIVRSWHLLLSAPSDSRSSHFFLVFSKTLHLNLNCSDLEVFNSTFLIISFLISVFSFYT